MNEEIIIRNTTPHDCVELLKIYAPYVEKTAISFEYEVPSLEEFQNRMEKITQKYPYLVAEKDGELLGYAYAAEFKGRPAYDWSVESTIYLKHSCTGKGIGKKLYQKLEDMLRRQNILNMNACIAWTDTEDEYLNNTSSLFHQHMGFTEVGKFHNSGCKFGRWYDMIWMEKMLGEHRENPKEVRFASSKIHCEEI